MESVAVLMTPNTIQNNVQARASFGVSQFSQFTILCQRYLLQMRRMPIIVAAQLVVMCFFGALYICVVLMGVVCVGVFRVAIAHLCGLYICVILHTFCHALVVSVHVLKMVHVIVAALLVVMCFFSGFYIYIVLLG
jgi:hypothetical protein